MTKTWESCPYSEGRKLPSAGVIIMMVTPTHHSRMMTPKRFDSINDVKQLDGSFECADIRRDPLGWESKHPV